VRADAYHQQAAERCRSLIATAEQAAARGVIHPLYLSHG
jgi:hypothetical protein